MSRSAFKLSAVLSPIIALVATVMALLQHSQWALALLGISFAFLAPVLVLGIRLSELRNKQRHVATQKVLETALRDFKQNLPAVKVTELEKIQLLQEQQRRLLQLTLATRTDWNPPHDDSVSEES